ncbi:hypothetical protein NBRC116589_43700 [Ruegeria sp. HU-ET01832]|uniref:hypothetical protein n=1 Tax=Ruegeria sp. HU-ET01832 TaxID=3135906 RepID=UPI003104C4C9
MNNREKWVSKAKQGVEEERRRLERDGPSLERYRQTWLDENRAAFAAQAEWQERRGHPLAEIITNPKDEP